MPPRSTARTATIPPKAPAAVPAPAPSKLSTPAPAWLRAVILGLGVLLLISVFTTESGDTDTWWHLKTGQFILEQHKLPVPDPFSWTTYLGKPVYAGEETTRYFNLTHEWLSQVLLYGSYAAGGFRGLILMRAIWLTAFCAIAGLIAYRRTGGFYRSLGVAFATVFVLRNFVADRPQFVTYLFLAVTILILESRKRLWLLPPLFLIWANCHAGFIMGWVVMGAYCGESLVQRFLRKPVADERTLWTMCVGAIALSGINPNVYNVVPVLRYYRQSALQSIIWEWQMPKYWELSPFTILLYGSAVFLLLNFRKTRPVDWFLLLVFGSSSLMATRNIFLIGLWGPILIATYLPKWEDRRASVANWAAVAVLAVCGLYYLTYLFSIWVVAAIAAAVFLVVTKKYPIPAEGLVAALLIAGIAFQVYGKYGFQFRGAMWKYPVGAADFLLEHHIKGRIFNTYAQGGYLIWRLWPEQKVFLDGRALNESVYQDSNRITMNADAVGGKTGEQLLKDYGIDVIIMDCFESVSGHAFYLPAALADPSQKEWKLVYQDVHDVIYMRNPPPDVTPLQSLDALVGMERQCAFYVQNGQAACARGLVDIFSRIGDRERLLKWQQVYRERGVPDSFTVVKR
jgi:hypothetical protein